MAYITVKDEKEIKFGKDLSLIEIIKEKTTISTSYRNKLSGALSLYKLGDNFEPAENILTDIEEIKEYQIKRFNTIIPISEEAYNELLSFDRIYKKNKDDKKFEKLKLGLCNICTVINNGVITETHTKYFYNTINIDNLDYMLNGIMSFVKEHTHEFEGCYERPGVQVMYNLESIYRNTQCIMQDLYKWFKS